MLWSLLYLSTIVAANWAIQTFGFVPVGFGFVAPAGVYFAGLAFTFRDLTQERLGKKAVIFAIFLGAGLSFYVSSAQFAIASGAAFLLSEILDFFVYTPLRSRNYLIAVAASNTVGLVVDSAFFLLLAFGSLHFLPGQIIGKVWMTIFAVVLLGVIRARTGRGNPLTSNR